jgi:hypothetical protein
VNVGFDDKLAGPGPSDERPPMRPQQSDDHATVDRRHHTAEPPTTFDKRNVHDVITWLGEYIAVESWLVELINQ